jgi:electron transfer flavoprotein alpha subunit
MRALVLADHDNAHLSAATRNVVGAAAQLGGAEHLEVDILVAGSGCAEVAFQAAAIAGVARVRMADAPHLADGLAENVALQVQALAGDYTHVLAAASSHGRNVLPRVAARMSCAQVSDVTAVLAHDTFERPIYAGNAIATVQSTDPVRFLTIRPTSFEAAAAEGGLAPVEAVEAVTDAGLSRFLGRKVAKSERPELQGARVVVAGGRALASKENFSLLERLADELGAALGASRAAVDAGYAPNDWQVGQTGKVVAPRLYVAVGISGAIQHLTGMKDSKVIVAINRDPDAPIFQVADYGLVADLFQAVPELIEKLKL